MGELLTGILFILAYLKFGWSIEMLIAIILFSFLTILTLTDLHYRRIPNSIVLTGVIIALVLRTFYPLESIWNHLFGAVVGFFALLLIAILSKGGMGGGDIKLYAMIGLFIGWKGVLLSLMLAAFVGSIYGLILILMKQFKSKMTIPFAPSIMVGTVIAYGWGEQMIEGYIDWVVGL